MKELATFFGDRGNIVAKISEDTGSWSVHYGQADSPNLHKVFMTEAEATQFAVEYTQRGAKPTLLKECND